MAPIPNMFENMTISYIYKSSPMTSEPTFFRIRKVLGIENRPFPTQAILTIDVNDVVHDHYVVVEGENICRFLRQKRPTPIPCH
jgi:hypothetical protein